MFKYTPLHNVTENSGSPAAHSQYVFQFPNNYGASVIQGEFTYGGTDDLWELAVIEFDEYGNWDLIYTTPVTNDVIGYLTVDEVNEYLDRIAALPIIPDEDPNKLDIP